MISNIGLGGEKLIRNLEIDHRNQYREETLKNYKMQTNRNINSK